VFNQLAAIFGDIDVIEFLIRKRKGFEKCFRNASHSDSILGLDAAVGDTGKKASQGLGKAGDGDESLRDGFKKHIGSISPLSEHPALVIGAIFGIRRGAGHAATAVGIAKRT